MPAIQMNTNTSDKISESERSAIFSEAGFSFADEDEATEYAAPEKGFAESSGSFVENPLDYEEDLENIPVQKSFFLCGIFLWLIYSLLGCDVIVFSFSFPYPNV